MLIKRTLAALVLIPFVLFTVHLGGPVFLLATLIINIISLREFDRLTRCTLQDGSVSRTQLPILFVTTSILLILTAVEGQFNPLLLSFIFAILFWSVLIKNKVEGAIDQLIYPLFGLFFITVPLAVMLLLRQTTAGEGALLAVLVTLWGVDSFAYLGGVRFGKRPLAPVFSPKKSVEGLIFGFLGGAFLLFLLNSYHIQLFTPIGIVAFALMMTLFGQGGDLLESCIKRTGGCKDSGSLIPGHGGLLDRIDSLLFSLPVAYAWFTISKSSIIGGLF